MFADGLSLCCRTHHVFAHSVECTADDQFDLFASSCMDTRRDVWCVSEGRRGVSGSLVAYMG